MKSKGYIINYKALLVTVIVLSVLGVLGFLNLDFDADIVGSLPKKDPVLSDSAYVLQHHPMQNLVVIDIHHQKTDLDILVEAGNLTQKELRSSSMFENVGMETFEDLVPDMMMHVSENLPVLFSEKDLIEKIEPLLTSENIKKKLKETYIGLQDINSIGLAEMLSKDPLGFSDTILAKLLYLSPSENADFYNGHLISRDGKHLMIVAEPATSGTNTDFARKATALIDEISDKLNNTYQEKGFVFTVDHIGSYRYALDNETIAKKDTKRAILFATLGIALMLIFVFPRPLMGLFSFLPAIAGTITSFFIYSLFHDKISMLALGFGGAIISITVDHGIAYLLFLDRNQETRGKEAAREVWSVGLLATLTTAFAFFSLLISGFPVLEQVGQFAAFGILFSFIFVHTIFPRIFPNIPPAKREKPFIIKNFVNKLALFSTKSKLISAAIFFLGMLVFAKPVFHVDLSSLNTISADTSKSEKHIRKTWGNISDRIFLVSEAQNIEELRATGDKIAAHMEKDISSEILSPSFATSMIFPGIERSHQNFTAWKNFWTRKSKANLKAIIQNNALEIGFSTSAFDPFFSQINAESFNITPLPEKFYKFFSIQKKLSLNNKSPLYRQFYTLSPGKYYHAETFFTKYLAAGNVKIFDPNHFTQKLGENLTSTFIRMFLIISISLTLFLILFFADLKLTITALMPVIFAFICTLGTMKILSRPIDIPGLMLSIVVLGMGIDYSLYFVRSHQRYLNERHSSFAIIRTAVFLASMSTMIGFGVMCFANHSLLKSAGMTSFFGIFYSLIGAFFILPFTLNRLFNFDKKHTRNVKFSFGPTSRNVMKYYRHMEGLVRIYARMKLKLDPMYKELGNLLTSPKHFIDIGCGYGVTAIWILDHFPESKVFGVEPNFERSRIAGNAFKNRGTVKRGIAPDLPKLPKNADTALMLDMAHYLNDNDLQVTLKKLHAALIPNGNLLMRVSKPSKNSFFFLRWIEVARLKIFKNPYRYRNTKQFQSIISQSGFKIISTQSSGKSRDKVWFLAIVAKSG
ncbi:MAG: MMPL family transporter [Deltaproteobacteria bacterium]|nr:MMPL family transporter [Deltaproteobacteria bacterium]